MGLLEGIIAIIAIASIGIQQNKLTSTKTDKAIDANTPIMMQCVIMCKEGVVTEFRQGSIKCDCDRGE